MFNFFFKVLVPNLLSYINFTGITGLVKYLNYDKNSFMVVIKSVLMFVVRILNMSWFFSQT